MWECVDSCGHLTRPHARVGACQPARVSEAMGPRRASRAVDARPSAAGIRLYDDVRGQNLVSSRATQLRCPREVLRRLSGLTVYGL